MLCTASRKDGPGLLSPEQVGEISRLLGLYRGGGGNGDGCATEDTAHHSPQDPPVAELLTYLRDLQTRLVLREYWDMLVYSGYCTCDHSSDLLHNVFMNGALLSASCSLATMTKQLIWVEYIYIYAYIYSVFTPHMHSESLVSMPSGSLP